MNVTPLAAREAGGSPLAKPKIFRRPSWSHILIAVAVLIAFIFNFLALQDQNETVLVAVADSPLGAGQRISSSDIRFVPIDANFEGLEGLLGESDWEQMEGWVLARPVSKGAALDVSNLNAPVSGSNLRTMSIPIGKEHAAGGLLAPGDQVDVVSVVEGVAGFVATGVQVVGLAPDESGGVGSFGGYHVVVAVTADQALRIAEAVDSGSVEVIGSTGAGPVGAGGDEDGAS